MNRDAFEQLVGAWLDEPGRDDLRARVETAVRDDPELAHVLDQWQRFDELFRRSLPEPRGVDWSRLKTRIAAAVDREAVADQRLDEALRRLQPVNHRVDWLRLRGRIVHALRRGEGPAGHRPRRYNWVAGGAALLAAAAALVFAFLPHAGPAEGSLGMVSVTVSRLPAADSQEGAGVAYVRIAAVEPAAEPSQRFFVVDPIKTTVPSDETSAYF